MAAETNTEGRVSGLCACYLARFFFFFFFVPFFFLLINEKNNNTMMKKTIFFHRHISIVQLLYATAYIVAISFYFSRQKQQSIELEFSLRMQYLLNS